MALIEAARFHTLSEAQVAVSMLRSAGIPASVSDLHYGTVFWMEQAALGGFRVSVPSPDVEDAVALLRSPEPTPDFEPIDAFHPALDAGRRVLAVGLLATMGPAAGWLIARRRPYGPSLGQVLVGALMAGLAVAMLALGLTWIAGALGVEF